MHRLLLAIACLVPLGCQQNGPPPPGPVPQPPGTVPAVTLVNMIPATLSGEENQDSEPFLAVDRSNPARMAASAFTPNPFGTASGLAPIYVSQDAGNSWTLNNIVPSAGSLGTSDITVAANNLRLYAGILRIPGSLLLNTLETSDFTAPTPMNVLASRSDVDQPFVQTATVGGAQRVYVASNDFGASLGRTATIDLSVDGGVSFRTVRIESRSTSGQDGPSVRPTIANDHTVYAGYFRWKQLSGFLATADVVVVRDDSGGTGTTAFRDLVDPSDGLPGRLVAQDVTIPWSNAPTLAEERIGSTLSIAVDRGNSATVYLAWADRVGNGDIYTVHLRRSTDHGQTWSGDLRTITNATCIAVAVADNGTAGFLYQQLTGAGGSQSWETHVEQSRDGFASPHRDTLLATVPANTPPRQFLPYTGDYNFLLSIGDEFRGIFSANNEPDITHFPRGVRYQRRADFNSRQLQDAAGNPVAVSIDPFYFAVSVVQ